MKKISLLISSLVIVAFVSCKQGAEQSEQSDAVESISESQGGQEAVKDDDSQKDIVKIAVGSKDHTTLVAALQQAEYVNDLANAGPFTVFAPVNAAFDKLPAGTVDDLMKPENKDKLREILEYHVAVGGYKMENFTDGQTINMANLKNVTINVKDGKTTVNGANIVATVPASNGIVYVVDAVLLPPADK